MIPQQIDFKLGHPTVLAEISLCTPRPDQVNDLPGLADQGEEVFVVWGLWVKPEHQGHGLASQLLVTAQEFARSVDRDIYLWVTPYREESLTKRQLQRFYRRYGFRRVARGVRRGSWYVWRRGWVPE